MCEKEIMNSLIISPPSFGKTTILKDIIEKYNEKISKPILIIDERGEFADVDGENIDRVVYSNKLYAFTCGIRSMSPSIVFTDEIVTSLDWDCVKSASNCGVKVVASCHGASIEDVVSKPFFCKGIFERYFILESKEYPGILKSVYDKDLKLI